MASIRHITATAVFFFMIVVPLILSADTFDDDPVKAIQRFVKDALKAAADIPEPHERAHALAEIAVVQSQTVSKEAGKQTFQDAVKAARLLPADNRKQATERYSLLFSVAHRAADSHDWAGARALVDDIVANEPIRQFGQPPTHEVHSFLRRLIYQQIKAGQLDEAAKTAEADPSADLDDDIRRGKAEQRAAAKDWAQALKFAAEIKDVGSRIYVIMHIAVLQHDAGQKEPARRKLNDARQLIEGLDASFSKNQWLDSLVQAYRKIGDRQTALQLAESMKNSSPNYPAREGTLSFLHAELGDFPTALEYARKVREIQPTSEYYFRRVAELQAKGKQFKNAWRTVEEMKEGYFRTQATLAIGQEQHRAGLAEDAAETFRIAVRTAEETPVPEALKISYTFEHASIFRQIAKTQTELGEVAAAHAWIRRQFSPKNQAYALLGVAEGLQARLQAQRMKR